MPLSEATAGTLDPVQAADLLHLLESEAQWEGLRASPTWHDAAGGLDGLRTRQRAYDAFRARLVAYQARYRADHSTGPLGGNPARFAGWCRAVAAVCLRAGAGAAPAALLGKAYGAAERMGARVGVALERPPVPGDVAGAAEGFSTLARWCDGLAAGVTEKRAA